MKGKARRLIITSLILSAFVISIVEPSAAVSAQEAEQSLESEGTIASAALNTEGEEHERTANSVSDELQAPTESVVLPLSSPRTAGSSQVKGYVPATPEELAAANDAANRKIGFNPEVKVVAADTWQLFREAYNDSSVTKIVVTANIDNSSNQTLTVRRTSIEIDGGGHTVHLNRRALEINSPTDGIGFFHIHDMVAQQRLNNGLTAASYYAFVNGTHFTANVSGWTFRTGNITTQPTDGNRVGRFIRAYQSEVQVYGKMSLHTTEENYYAGSVIIEDKTDWYGEVTYANYSAVWFVENSTTSGSTSKSQEFTIGDNSRVVLKNSSTGATYPAVYHHYKSLTVGANSVYNANMQGNAVRFDQVDAQMTVKQGAVVNLLSRGAGEVLQYSSTNSALTVEPGGSLYIVGNTPNGVVNLRGAGGHSLYLDNPAGFDIRNNHSSGKALAMDNATNLFSIKSSDIDLWNVGSPILGPSQESYALVDHFSVKNAGGSANVVTSESSLAAFTVNRYRRIAGMNAKPEVQWQPVTDADKTYRARVLIGQTPGDSYDEFGNVILQPVYASANQAQVTYTDTFGETRLVPTDSDGYAAFTDSRFAEAGKELSATATRGPWISDEEVTTKVIDVTPPEPAKVNQEELVSPIAKRLSGTGETHANVSFSLNGVAKPDWQTAVDGEGNWQLALPVGGLKQGDKIQIFLQDHAGKALGITPPATNSAVGNRNPETDLTYRDARFKAGTVVTVNGVLALKSAPKNIAFGSVSILAFTELVGVDRGNLDTGLIVEDSRGARGKWDITAQVIEEMTNDGDVLVGALKYYYNDDLVTLTASPQTIYHNEANDEQATYNISEGWGKEGQQAGLKFQAKGDIVPKTTGSYSGTVRWTLRDTIE